MPKWPAEGARLPVEARPGAPGAALAAVDLSGVAPLAFDEVRFEPPPVLCEREFARGL